MKWGRLPRLGYRGWGQALPSAASAFLPLGCGLKAEPSIKQTASLRLSVPTPILTESGFHHPLITEASHSLCLSVHTHQPPGPWGDG